MSTVVRKSSFRLNLFKFKRVRKSSVWGEEQKVRVNDDGDNDNDDGDDECLWKHVKILSVGRRAAQKVREEAEEKAAQDGTTQKYLLNISEIFFHIKEISLK